MPRTASQLLKATEANRRAKAEHVVLTGVKPGYRKDGSPKLNAVAYSTHNADGTPNKDKTRHRLVIYSTNNKQRLNGGHIKVHCTCSDFMFTYEWVLTQLGAADLINATNEDPGIRNPSHRPGVCCHLYRLLNEVVRAKV